MVLKGVFRETKEAYIAQYKTKEGLFVVLLGNFLWGYLIINYNKVIFDYIVSVISFLPQFTINYIGYFLFGLLMIPIDLLIIYVLAKLFVPIPIKNGRVF